MVDFFKVLAILALTAIGLIFFFLLLVAFQWVGILVIAALFAIYGWMLYAFFYYRFCRREDLLNVLANAAETGVPLAPALRAYLRDRPRGNMRSFWLATLLCIFPVPGFYWIWYRHFNFDRKVEELAQYLELGAPLHHVLQSLPALASHEAVLAAAIGERTGQLGRCLRGAAQRRLTAIRMEMIPKIVYPFAMLIAIAGIVSFIDYFIVPKFKKIFMDFGVQLPRATQLLLADSDYVVEYWYVIVFAMQLFLVTVAVLALSSTARWYFPGLGVLYRRFVRGRVLRQLSLLLETGRTVPESLSLLCGLPMGVAALRLLDRARFRIEQGEAFGDSLSRVGLLSPPMLPLVLAAERASNLPWALAELADTLHNRTVRATERIMQVAFPIVVLLLGLLVGFIIVSMFMPLVTLITELSG